MIRKADAENLSSWIQGQLVYNHWKPVDLDETVICKGYLHHKDGRVESFSAFSNLQLSEREQRMAIIKAIATNLIKRGGQCLIAVESRKGVEEIANDLFEHLNTEFLDPDLRVELDQQISASRGVREQVRNVEPKLPAFAEKLWRFLGQGVAFHHAGLPLKYREIVEDGLRNRAIRIIVSTTTFEAGVNLPLSHVIFPFPKGYHKGRNRLGVNTYKNLSGRAGRPGYDVQGQSILVALTEPELRQYFKEYIESEGELLDSGLRDLMNRTPTSRSILQSQLLGISSLEDLVPLNRFIEFSQKTWFWKQASPQQKETFEKHVSTEVWKLCVYGFLQKVSSNAYQATKIGKSASRSVLSPLSLKILVDNTKKVMVSKTDGRAFDSLVLGLVGLPWEMDSYDNQMKQIKPSEETSFITSIITSDPAIREQHQRVEYSRKFSTILSKWTESLPSEEVLQKCGLDPSLDAAFLEESLSKDANWILSTLLSFPDRDIFMNKNQEKRVEELARFCLYGSSDPLTIELLSLGLRHLGRNSAIPLSKFLRQTGRTLKDLDSADLKELFPENPSASGLLYQEIRARTR